jgi:acyl-coenzyme A thioesterase PaaI-like protein
VTESGVGRFDFDEQVDPNDARGRLADAARHIIDELARSSASFAAFSEAAALVQQASAVLEQGAHDRPYDEPAEASLREHQRNSFLHHSPFVGRLNPLAPPITMRIDGAAVIGEVTYGAAYEGPPGCVHGGFIAAGFDEVLGFTQSFSGQPGRTARLSVSYRSPTPLWQPLRYAGQLDRVEGRKIYVQATLRTLDDRLCAEAEGLFISMKPEVFQRLVHGRRPAADEGDEPIPR